MKPPDVREGRQQLDCSVSMFLMAKLPGLTLLPTLGLSSDFPDPCTLQTQS